MSDPLTHAAVVALWLGGVMRRLALLIAIFILFAVAIAPAYAAPPAPYTNLVTNGNFTSSFSSWNRGGNTVWDVMSQTLHVYGPSSVSTFYQDLPYSSVLNYPYEINFLMGNSASASKTVQVTLSNGVNSTGWIMCSFVVPANAPLLNYRIVGLDGQGWAQIRLAFTFTTFSSSPALSLDNVSVEYWAGAQTSGTVCTAPTATATPTFTHTFTPTFTPSQTPTRTPTFTPTPDFFIEFDLGDNQYARVERTVSGGDYVIVLLLFIVLFGLGAVWLLRELRVNKKS